MLERINDEVYYLRADRPEGGPDGSRTLDAEALTFLVDKARANPRGRCRICTHADPAAAIHEMFIAHGREVYVPPHAHTDRAESLSIVSGLATLFLLDERGGVASAVRLGPAGSGRALTVVIPAGLTHTQVFESDMVVFHEVTSGPFNPAAATRAAYAPADDDPAAQAEFKARLMALAAQA
jgi:cupin fold WbuC family metalloprotein